MEVEVFLFKCKEETKIFTIFFNEEGEPSKEKKFRK